MSNNKPYYYDPNAVPFRMPYPYGPYMPTPPYGPQWAPQNPQQLPLLWTAPNDHYRRCHYTAVNTHKEYCCLSNSNRRGCHKSVQLCAKCHQLCHQSGDASEADNEEVTEADNEEATEGDNEEETEADDENELCGKCEDPIVDLFQKESNVGKVFGNDLWPIIELHFTQTTTDAVPQESEDVMTETPIDKNCEPVKDVVTLQMAQPIPQQMAKPKAQLIPQPMTREEKFKAMASTEGDNRERKGSSNKSSNSDSSHSLNGNTDTQRKPTAQQQKIIDKLKTIHSNLSEEVLFEKILETKEMIVSFGYPKGFSGMKLTEVVEAVSKFIASEVVSDSSDIETPPEEENQKDSKCRICGQLIKGNDLSERLTLSCGHTYHFRCLDVWAQTNNKCAECHQFF